MLALACAVAAVAPLFLLVDGGFIISRVLTTSEEIEIELYNSILWRGDFDPVYNATLINLCADRDVFDYCDLTMYSKEGVQPLLARHGYGVSREDHPLKWIGVIDSMEEMKAACGIPTSWTTSYKFQWERVALAPDIQALGCEGYIGVTATGELLKFLDLPYLDRKRETVFGTTLNIFSTYMIRNEKERLLREILQESYESRTPLIVSKVSPSDNYLDTAVTDPLSFFRVSSLIYLVLSVACTVYNLVILRRYYRTQGSNFSFMSYCSISMVLNAIANVMRVTKSVDVLGFLSFYPSIVGRVMYSVTVSIGLASVVATYFYWLEAVVQIKKSLDMVIKKVTGRYRILAAVVCVSIISVELSLVYFAYYGRFTSSDVVAYSTMFFLLIDLILVVAGFRTYFIVVESIKNTHAVVTKKIEEDRSKATESKNKTEAQKVATIALSATASVAPSSAITAVRSKVDKAGLKSSIVTVRSDKVYPSYSATSECRPSPSAADVLMLKINYKCILGSRILFALSVNLLVLMAFTALLGNLALVYSSPTMVGVVFIGFALLELSLSFLELKLIAVSMKPIV